MRYGMTQPTGGATKASTCPCQGPKEVDRDWLVMRLRVRAMAATSSVPSKLVHPCIADVGSLSPPKGKHDGIEPVPGQRSPQSK